jgi:hypothetical protein
MKINNVPLISYSLPQLMELREQVIQDKLDLKGESKVYVFLEIEKTINRKKYVNRIKKKKENSIIKKTNVLMNKIKFIQSKNKIWIIHIEK